MLGVSVLSLVLSGCVAAESSGNPTTTVIAQPGPTVTEPNGETPDTTIVGAESVSRFFEFEDQGRDHLSAADVEAVLAGTLDGPPYNSDPPTSGTHAGVWAQCGVFRQSLPDVVQVHSLEHGAVIIHYHPEIDPEDIAALESFVREKGSHVIAAPDEDLDAYIALTAWTVLLEMDVLDMELVNGFWLDYASEGPELVPCPVEVDESPQSASTGGSI